MPRTSQEVDQLIGQLKAARDAMDASADTEAPRKTSTADSLEAEVDSLESQIPAIRQRMNFQRDAKDQPGRDADAEEIRSLVQQAAQKKQQAAKERMNAARMLSLKHDVEKASDREICVHCVGHIDDNGDVVGAFHYRMPIEDVEVKDESGAVVKTVPGLRSLLRDEEADLDPADGRLRIKGVRVGG